MSITRETFGAMRAAPVEVPIPEWGASVFVRVMTGDERFDWVKYVAAEENNGRRNMAALLVRTICDENGQRLFTDSDEDVALVAGKDVTVLDRLNSESLKLNHIGDDAVDDAKKN